MVSLIKRSEQFVKKTKDKLPFGIKFLALLLIAFVIIVSRRPSQFYHPYIWVEDGALLLPQYLKDALSFIFIPINGYLIVISKIIFSLSILVSFLYYPEISYAFTMVFTLGVIAAIALSPTLLRSSWICAILTLFIPTDPEVFGVGLYTFWWAGILLILALIWNMKGQKNLLRNIYIILGGLSSPIIIALTPLFWVRIFLFRKVLIFKKTEIFTAGLTSFIALIQLGLLFSMGQVNEATIYKINSISLLVERFFGNFLVYSMGNQTFSLIIGIFLLLLILLRSTIEFKAKNYGFILLASAFFLISLMSGMRVEIEQSHPVLTTPRYFFYPYVTLIWLLVWVLTDQRGITRIVSVSLIGFALANAMHSWARYHDALSWRKYVIECYKNRQKNLQSLPIHFAGSSENTWFVEINQNECKRLINGSLFDTYFLK